MSRLSPVDIKKQLLYCFLNHKTSPYNSGILSCLLLGRFWKKVSHGHSWQPMVHDRQHCTAFLTQSGVKGERGKVKRTYQMSRQVHPNVEDPSASVWMGRICQDQERQHEGDVRGLVVSAWQARKRGSLNRLIHKQTKHRAEVIMPTCDRTLPDPTFATCHCKDLRNVGYGSFLDRPATTGHLGG